MLKRKQSVNWKKIQNYLDFSPGWVIFYSTIPFLGPSPATVITNAIHSASHFMLFHFTANALFRTPNWSLWPDCPDQIHPLHSWPAYSLQDTAFPHSTSLLKSFNRYYWLISTKFKLFCLAFKPSCVILPQIFLLSLFVHFLILQFQPSTNFLSALNALLSFFNTLPLFILKPLWMSSPWIQVILHIVESNATSEATSSKKPPLISLLLSRSRLLPSSYTFVLIFITFRQVNRAQWLRAQLSGCVILDKSFTIFKSHLMFVCFEKGGTQWLWKLNKLNRGKYLAQSLARSW